MADTARAPAPPAPPPAGAGAGPPGEDWPAQVADAIERTVGAVRDKTAVPLDRLARIVVYGTLAAILGAASLVLLTVAAVRGINVAVPEQVWAAHAITGGIFTVSGLFLWSKRSTRA